MCGFQYFPAVTTSHISHLSTLCLNHWHRLLCSVNKLSNSKFLSVTRRPQIQNSFSRALCSLSKSDFSSPRLKALAELVRSLHSDTWKSLFKLYKSIWACLWSFCCFSRLTKLVRTLVLFILRVSQPSFSYPLYGACKFHMTRFWWCLLPYSQIWILLPVKTPGCLGL